MSAKYLYAASVQGIQSFIFKTNKLKEIVGASSIVDDLCKDFFNKEFRIDDDNIYVQAAGNVKCVVDEATCRKIVRNFPKLVLNKAPGITISQAVVKLTGAYWKDDEITKKAISEIERRLSIQRNRPVMPVDIGYMGLERARRTGGVAVDVKEGAIIDRSTQAKTENPETNTLALFKTFSGKEVDYEQIPFNLKDIIGAYVEKSWIAIVHADGNSIGKRIQKLTPKEFKQFSKNLQSATKASVQRAFRQVIEKVKCRGERFPIRPVILGGDDVTLIIRADLALPFTEAYLAAFEEETKKVIGEALTACAGIAYIKQNYPFHYGVNLAEELTKEAKKKAKEIDLENPPSALSFYKVLSSFIEPLKEMKQRTHRVMNKNMKEDENKTIVSFDHGPYFLRETSGQPLISTLISLVQMVERSNDLTGVGKLRHWLTLLHKNPKEAELYLDRMKMVNPAFYKELQMDNERNAKSTIIYDVVQLYSFEPKKENLLV